jgi:peptidoglycan/LPS O-acetylase OafA/YrhL
LPRLWRSNCESFPLFRAWSCPLTALFLYFFPSALATGPTTLSPPLYLYTRPRLPVTIFSASEFATDRKDRGGSNHWVPHVIQIFALFMLLGLIVSIWATPETKGKSLEELSGEDQDNFLQPADAAPAGHARV